MSSVNQGPGPFVYSDAQPLYIKILGEPMAQPRGKVRSWHAKDGRSGTTVYDPGKAKTNKANIAHQIQLRLEEAGIAPPFFAEDHPVRLRIVFIRSCPTTRHRKREPAPQIPHIKKQQDIDNLLKLFMDAATPLLWLNDGQVYSVTAEKYIAAQGDVPRTEVWAW